MADDIIYSVHARDTVYHCMGYKFLVLATIAITKRNEW